MSALLTTALAACGDATGVTPDPQPDVVDACAAGAQPPALAVGGSTAYWAGSAGSICLDGGAGGAEYLVVGANTATTATTTLALRATAKGVEAPLAALALAPEGPVPTLGAAALAAAVAAAGAHSDGGFHDRLRRREREQLTARMPQARSALGAQRAELGVMSATPEVGSLHSFNVNAQAACTSADMRTGRVTLVSQHAVIIADTANPSPGFTSADYQQIAAAFDTLITPVVTGAFGQPTDIDGNGRVVIFYTRAVNEMTPRGAEHVVGGFVYGRDLFPRTGAGACATSNEAEMFYMLAPDPAGTINGHRRTVEYVRQSTLATLPHEYQHLINVARRLHVTNATAFERVWLDEGLAHIAEELVFYRAAGLAPRQDIGIQTILAQLRRTTAYNNYQAPNVGRFETFLKAPSASSPWALNDSLSTRGATWHLLRYAVDQRSGNENDAWRVLAGGPAIGTENLANVFGSDLPRLHANWTTSVAVDNTAGAGTAALSFPSWNLRSIYAALERPAYPLQVRTLANDQPLETTLAGGGAVYYRLRVPGGGRASLVVRRTDGQTLPGGFAATVVRMQ